jgi:hypothetical protein
MPAGAGASPNEPCHGREYLNVIQVFFENKLARIMKKQSHTIKVASPSGTDGCPAVVKIKISPTEEQIRQRACILYALYGARRGHHPLIDRLQAERGLKDDILGAERKRG